MNYVVIKNNFP